MNLTTHTGYPEITITAAFDWSRADQIGHVEHPAQVPTGADITPVFPWVARILSRSGEVLDEFTGNAGTRPEAKIAAVNKLQSVADEYLKESE